MHCGVSFGNGIENGCTEDGDDVWCELDIAEESVISVEANSTSEPSKLSTVRNNMLLHAIFVNECNIHLSCLHSCP